MVDTFSYDTLYSEKSIDDPLKPAAHATYDFAVAYPAPETLPMDGLIQALQVAVDSDSEKVLAEMAYYPQQLGALELREYTCAKLAADRGFTVTPEEVALTNGSGEALGLVIQALTNPGDVVLAEEFVYMGTTAQLRRFGADIRGIAMDKGGIIPEALDDQIVALTAAGEKPKYLYTIPEHQNPVGSTLSTERRKPFSRLLTNTACRFSKTTAMSTFVTRVKCSRRSERSMTLGLLFMWLLIQSCLHQVFEWVISPPLPN